MNRTEPEKIMPPTTEELKTTARQYFNREPEFLRLLEQQGGAPRNYSSNIRHLGIFYFHLTTGGIQRVILLLCEIFRELGYQITLILETAPDTDDFKPPEGVEIVYLNSQTNQCSADNIAGRIEQWQEIFAERQLDVIYHHGYASPVLLWDLLAAKTAGLPFILHHHNLFASSLFRLKKSRLFSYEPALLRQCDRVITLSRLDNRYWQLQGVNCVYLPNPCDRKLQANFQTEPADNFDRKELLWLARIRHEKNPLDVIPIFARVRQQIPDARLTIVGGGEEKILNRMRQQLTEHHLEEAVNLTGNQPDAYGYYRQAAVFLLTSTFEGFSMTIVEAGSFGIPLVAYAMPTLETLRDNPGAIQVPQDDIDAAAAAIVGIMTDKARYRQMSAASREFIRRLAGFDLRKGWQEVFTALGQETAAIPVPPADPEFRTMLEEIGRCYAASQNRRDEQIKKLQKQIAELRKRVKSQPQAERPEEKLRPESAANRSGNFFAALRRLVKKGLLNLKERGLRNTLKKIVARLKAPAQHNSPGKKDC